MSVVIRGMKMPKDCLKCPFCLFADGYWKCLVDGSHADFGGTCRPSLCPLVPVPPHGRLIDADALKDTPDYYIREAGWSEEINEALTWVRDEFIDHEPTIIEAEVSE